MRANSSPICANVNQMSQCGKCGLALSGSILVKSGDGAAWYFFD